MKPGLCSGCANARMVPGSRSEFWMCRLSVTDPRFPRYPRLPVVTCAGFAPGEPERPS